MEKIKLSPNFFLYLFTPDEGKLTSKNIYVLLNGREALLIDAAFPEQSRYVLDDLAKDRIRIRKIIVSHYHADHYLGIENFDDVEIIGSQYYKKGFYNEIIIPEDETFMPRRIISDKTNMLFGDFSITILPSPGHSQCQLHTVINDSFVHVGDTLISSLDNRPILPLVFYDISTYIATLKNLTLFREYTILLGHGKPIKQREQIDVEIEGRIVYLKNLLAKGASPALDECLEGCKIDFLNKEWHERNRQRICR